MKHLRFWSCIFIISVNSSFLFAAKPVDWNLQLTNIELDASGGHYKSALKKNLLLISKIGSNQPQNYTFLSQAYLQQARIYEGLGELENYKLSLEKGKGFINQGSKDAHDYCKALLSLANSYLQYGNLYEAQTTIIESKSILDKSPTKDLFLLAKVNNTLSEIYFHQGYLNKADDLIPLFLPYYKSRIVKKENITDQNNGKTTFRTLPRNELQSRKRDYANALNHWALIQFNNGNIARADSIIGVCAKFIKSEFSKKDISYVINLSLQAQLHESKNDFEKAFEKYYEALKTSSSSYYVRFKSTSKVGMSLYEKTIITSRLSGHNKQGKMLRDIFASQMKRAYGKANIHFSRHQLVEAERHFINADFDKAEAKIKEILNNPSLPPIHTYRARALQCLNKIYLKEDRYEKAEEALIEISNIQKTLSGEGSPKYHLSQLKHAAFQIQYSNKFLAVEETYTKSLDGVVAREIDHGSLLYVENIHKEASFFQLTDRFQRSLSILQKTSEELKNKYGTSHHYYALSLERLASVDIDLGKYEDAEQKLNTAINVYTNLGTTLYDYNLDFAHALETQARLFIIQGRYTEAEIALKKAYKLTRKVDKDDNLKISSATEELATLYIYTGRYQETEKSLLVSLGLKEKKFGMENRALITPLYQLGLLYLIRGNLMEADRYALRAAKLCAEIFGNNSVRHAEILKLLQSIYTSIGDYEKAEESGNKALKIQREQYGKSHIYVANTLSELALVKFYLNPKDRSVEGLFNQSLEIIKSTLGDKNPHYANVCINMAYFFLEIGKYQEAETIIDKANSIWLDKLGRDNIHSAEILFLKGNISFQKEKFVEARDRFNEAKNNYEKLFDNSHPHFLKAMSKSCQMSYILGDYKTAIKGFDQTTSSYLIYKNKYFPFLSEREKNKFWTLIKNDFEFYNTMAIRLGQANPDLIGNMYNFALQTKAILLSSSIKVKERILNSGDGELVKKYEDFISKKERLATLLSQTAEQRKANGVDLKELEKEVESLEKHLSSTSELFVSDNERNQELTWQRVRESLKQNEVAIEILRFRYFDKSFTDSVIYAALIVTPETKLNPDLIVVPNGNALESKFLKYYRNSIKYNTEDQVSYDAFWKPIKTLIKDKSVIYLSAEGVYNQINLESIKSPDDKFIIDNNEISLVSNTRDLIPISVKSNKPKIENRTQDRVTLIGNPNYYYNLTSANRSDSLKTQKIKYTVKPLPGAEKEIKSLHNLMQSSQWPSVMLLNDNATEKEVKNLQNPRVFHIATHGFFMEDTDFNTEDIDGLNDSKAIQNPLLRSGLLLTNGGKLIESGNVYRYNTEDGILTAYEAMNLNFDRTDLVVLSACETGLGEVQIGEGVYGLQRAFLVAGAKSVIMSLFKVSDEVTQELMVSFFKKWIQTGNKRKAFLEAKKEIKQLHPEPIYWASFIMIGQD